jgi:hypothetical protein
MSLKTNLALANNEDTIKNIGKLLTDDMVVFRDAIHVSVLPVIAAETLHPSTNIGFNADMQATKTPVNGKFIGKVDPWLEMPVLRGEKFYLWMNLGTNTSLRHFWTNQDVPDEFNAKVAVNVSADYLWLQEFANGVGIALDQLLDGAREWVADYTMMSDGGFKYDSLEIPDEFWFHFQRYTGIIVPKDRQQTFFTCC